MAADRQLRVLYGWNPPYALLLLFSTFVTFVSSLLIGRAKRRASEERKRKAGKLWVALCLTVNLGILFFYKYFDFAVDNLNALFGALGMQLHHADL